ncbi:unnamed protein product [Aphanomyces euteiches]|uniref:Uncharacterized protein n=1 Tax=Aphanomyces euteiches TaxID=100861 RepID=A0A6G0XJ22_9STRA|nr:hypothetical protein Ae201684_004288 [Aphanomyces euteiches]KAH9093592.1 hypothetical protein Ae201684P_016219 [Aphanomyces euteiches]KAH9153150.1 hypothetical protein AeRB84_004543 [Aphanomyces euteiches]
MNRVLRCRDFLVAITRFQRGVYEDLRPLAAWIDRTTCLALPTFLHDNGQTSIYRIVQAFHAVFDPWLAASTVDSAAALHRLFQCVHHLHLPALFHSIVYRRLDVLHVINERSRIASIDNVLDFAVRSGFDDVVRLLHSWGAQGCSTYAMDTAAHNCNLRLVEFLHANRSEGCTADAMDSAAWQGHLDVVRFLHSHRHEGCSERMMDWAAGNGHLNIVQFLDANRTNGCTTFAMDMAAERGHLHVVQWLHTNRTEGCTARAMAGALRNGHLAIIEYLKVHQVAAATTSAALAGLDCIRLPRHVGIAAEDKSHLQSAAVEIS